MTPYRVLFRAGRPVASPRPVPGLPAPAPSAPVFCRSFPSLQAASTATARHEVTLPSGEVTAVYAYSPRRPRSVSDRICFEMHALTPPSRDDLLSAQEQAGFHPCGYGFCSPGYDAASCTAYWYCFGSCD